MAEGQSLPEGKVDKGIAHKAIKKNSSIFKESGINPRKLAGILYKNKLISTEVFSQTGLDTRDLSDEDKLELLATEVQNNALINNGYFEKVVKCLHSVKDEKTSRIARAYTTSYIELLKLRQSVIIGVKERCFEGFRYFRRKFSVLQEGIVSLGYEIGGVVGKEIPEEISVMNDFDFMEDCESSSGNQDSFIQNVPISTSEGSLCLACGESVPFEEEPVHDKCLPDYKSCLRCFSYDIFRIDADIQCKLCLKFPQDSTICYYCGEEASRGLPVHESCFEKFVYCVRCLIYVRVKPHRLCADCMQYDQETAGYYSKEKEIKDVFYPIEELLTEKETGCLKTCSISEVESSREFDQNEVMNDLDAVVPLPINTADTSETTSNDVDDMKFEDVDIDYGLIFDQAVSSGCIIKVRWTKLSISGPPGSGKSSAICLLLDEKPVLIHDSTTVSTAPEIRAVSSNVLSMTATEDNLCTWEHIDFKAMIANDIKCKNFHFSFSNTPRTSIARHSSTSHTLHSEEAVPFREEFNFQEDRNTASQIDDVFEQPVDDANFQQSPVVEEIKELLKTPTPVTTTTDKAPPRIHHFIYTVDMGGQAAFLDIAPAILRYNSVNIVTHKLDERLSSKVNFFYSINGQRLSEPETRQLTHKQLLVSTIRSLSSSNPPEFKGINHVYCSRQKSSIIVLGTFFDKYNESMCEESLAAKEKLLGANLQSNESVEKISNGRYIFPVNTISRDEQAMETANTIRSKICESYIEADIPFKWFLFHMELQKLIETGYYAIHTDSCFEIGATLSISRKEVETVLHYYNELTVILYVPEVLPVTFLHPKPLFDKLTQLIIVSFPDGHQYFDTELPFQDVECFQKQGVFTVDLMQAICDFKDELFSADQFIHLLESLSIIVRIHNATYFLPSVLPTISKDTDEYDDLQAAYRTELDPVILSWKKTNITPQGLFSALVVDLLRSQQFKLKPNIQQYRNAVQFDCTGARCRVGSVLLVDNVLTMQVYYVSQGASFDRYNCRYVRDMILEGIKRIVLQLKYNDAIANPDELFICKEHEHIPKPHLCSLDSSIDRLLCLYYNTTSKINRQYQLPWLRKTNLVGTDLREVVNDLKEINFTPPKWYNLGLQLGLYQHTLDTIQADNQGSETRLMICLTKWLGKADGVKEATMITLGHALQMIGEPNI